MQCRWAWEEKESQHGNVLYIQHVTETVNRSLKALPEFLGLLWTINGATVLNRRQEDKIVLLNPLLTAWWRVGSRHGEKLGGDPLGCSIVIQMRSISGWNKVTARAGEGELLPKANSWKNLTDNLLAVIRGVYCRHNKTNITSIPNVLTLHWVAISSGSEPQSNNITVLKVHIFMDFFL